ncbi:MAG: hypothetical protein AAF699_17115 [Pseudomonadota bacterium]
MVNIEYVIKERIKASNASSFEIRKYSDWMELSEQMFIGDLNLTLNGFEFGTKNNYLITATEELILALETLAFYEDEVLFGYPERAMDIRLEKKDVQIKIAREIRGVTQYETSIDATCLYREIGKHSKKLIFELLDEYPELAESPSLTGPVYPHFGLNLYYYRLSRYPTLNGDPFA